MADIVSLDDHEQLVPVYVLKEFIPAKTEESVMPRGRKPGSTNKSTATQLKYILRVGDGGPGKNHVVSNPAEAASHLLQNNEISTLRDLTVRKMDKVYTMTIEQMPIEQAQSHVLPDIMVLQPAKPEDATSKEVFGKLQEVASQIDPARKFYGVGDDVLGLAVTIVEEKSTKKKIGKKPKASEPELAATTSPSA